MIDESKLILIDINVLGISSMHQWAFKDRCFKGKPTAAIQGTLEKLSRLSSVFPGHVPIVLWDDRCHWREAILPRYKRHRWETPEQQAFLESYLAQAVIVRQLIGHLGIPQIFCPGFEADDLAGVICRGVDPSWEVVLATSDSDWFQALRENVIWFSPHTEKQITLGDLRGAAAVSEVPFDSIDHFIEAKALAGDSSDGIPGVVGVGIKTAARIIHEHGSLESLWAKHDGGIPVKGVIPLRVAGQEYREIYRRNLRLIDWRLAPPLPAEFEFEMEAVNRRGFEGLCEAWGLTAGVRGFGGRVNVGEHVTGVAGVIERVLSAGSGVP